MDITNLPRYTPTVEEIEAMKGLATRLAFLRMGGAVVSALLFVLVIWVFFRAIFRVTVTHKKDSE